MALFCFYARANLHNFMGFIGSNQIRTIINGHRAEIKVFLRNGEVVSIDGFKGWSERTINKIIHYLP